VSYKVDSTRLTLFVYSSGKCTLLERRHHLEGIRCVEKSRVVKVSQHERSYHVFYQSIRAELHICSVRFDVTPMRCPLYSTISRVSKLLSSTIYVAALYCTDTVTCVIFGTSTQSLVRYLSTSQLGISSMGNSSSKSSSPKTTIKEGKPWQFPTRSHTSLLRSMLIDRLHLPAIDSVQRQINYRPAEQDTLSQDLDCLKKAQAQQFNTVTVDRKKVCSGSVHCERHQYKT